MSIKEGIVPPTINVTDKDPECDINVITKKIKADIKTAITNSFGFGGVNAVLVLKRAEKHQSRRAVEQKRRS
jgi:3-oxoacyl-[acyl-carrier-protein] synthase II